MPTPRLRNTDVGQSHDTLRDKVTELLQRVRCSSDHLAMVAANRGHILDNDVGRPRKLSEARHPEVEAVLRILTPSAVIEITVALTRWSSERDIDVTTELLQPSLCRGEADANPATKLTTDVHGL